MTEEQYKAIKDTFENFSKEDYVDAFCAWCIENPEGVKRFVDLLHAYVNAKYDLDEFLEI